MRWTNLLLAAAMLGALTPLAGADGDALCLPVSDATAKPLADEGYLRKSGADYEIWRETNDIPGLQTDSDMACGAAADLEWVELGASSL